MEYLWLMWLAVVTLGALCLLSLVLLVWSLCQWLQENLEKDIKAAERTLV